MAQNRLSLRFSVLAATGGFFFVLLFSFAAFAGTRSLSFIDGISAAVSLLSGSGNGGSSATILLHLRLPRATGATLCGASLSVSGLLLQLSLNNALASPGIIGVNAGAGFFALLASLAFPYATLIRAAGAFSGALLAVFIVYLISERAGISKTSLVLSGMAVSSLLTAGIDILITAYPEIISDKIAFSLGGFQNLSIASVRIAAPIIALSLVAALLLAGGIDLFALGDEAAFGLGLNVRACRLAAIATAAVLAGTAVSVCGLLGFVGLLVPNLVRLGGKQNTRQSIILCVILGADFLLLCDVLSRTLFFPYELPVGLFLSCMGSPFFIWMLVSRRKRLSV